MDEFSNKNTDNNFSNIQKGRPSLEQEIEDYNATETDELKVLPIAFEKKPVKNILFVDDEESICKIFKEALERFGYKVWLASNANEGLRCFKKNPVDLIITDIIMPEKDGHTFILEILKEFPETKIFAITGKVSFAPEMELDIAQTLGAVSVFRKPIKISELIAAIKSCHYERKIFK
jgi:CheY-like chemotaxis protein